jgi:hypothetical protein
VTFLIRPSTDTRGAFGARVVLVNTSAEKLERWTLVFEFSGDERATSVVGATFRQAGKKLTLSGAPALPAGKAAIIGIDGIVGRPQGPPHTFLVDDGLCTSAEYEVGPDFEQWPAPVPVTDPPALDELRNRPRPPGPGGPGGKRGPGGPPKDSASPLLPSPAGSGTHGRE